MILYCTASGCEKQAVYKVRELCTTHYRANQRAEKSREIRPAGKPINKDLLWDFIKKELQLQ